MTQRHQVSEFVRPDPFGRMEYEQNGQRLEVTATQNAWTLDGSSQLIMVDARLGPATVTLPGLSQANLGCQFRVQNVSRDGLPTNPVLVQPNGTDPVNEGSNLTSVTLRGANECATFVHLRFGFTPLPEPGHPTIDCWYTCGLTVTPPP